MMYTYRPRPDYLSDEQDDPNEMDERLPTPVKRQSQNQINAMAQERERQIQEEMELRKRRLEDQRLERLMQLEEERIRIEKEALLQQ